MSETFGANAARLAGAAARLLGWRPHEFWSATPAELASVLTVAGGDCAPPDRDTIAALAMQFPD